MSTIGSIASDIGIADRDGERAITMAVIEGRMKHAYLTDAREVAADSDAFEALYVAGGLFRDGSLVNNTGRSKANLTRVVWLQFDADLVDYLGCPPGQTPEAKAEREALKADLGAMPQAELDELTGALRADLEAAFATLKMPIHRLDYTGYGLCAYIYIDEADQTRIDDAQAAHKLLVKRINEVAGGDRLVDPECSDAGTRVTRLPGSLNRKGATPRLVTTIVPYTGQTAPLGIRPDAPRPMLRHILREGPGLSAADANAIVAALRPSWAAGQKNAMAIAVAGMLAKAGVPEQQAVDILEALSDPGDRPQERHRAVAHTYAKMRNGGAVAGFTKLQALIPAAALTFVDGVLGRYRGTGATQASASAAAMFDVISAAPRQLRENDQVTAWPAELRNVPDVCYTGWFKAYVDLVEPLCEAPRSFHLASALALTGATFGRSVCARYVSKNVYGNTYMMLVGLAGTSRKDTAIDFALDMPSHRGPGYAAFQVEGPAFKIVTDIGSAQAMIQALSKTPNVLLHITEYQRVSQNAQRQGSTIFPLLTAAWNTPRVVENVTLGNPIEAKFPYLSILAAVQPGILAQEMRQADIESGYATRWLFVVGDGKDEDIPDPDEIDEITAWKLYRELLQIRQRYDAEAESGREKRLILTARARDRWNDWYRADRRKSRLSSNEDEASMRSRLGTHIRKVALLYAATAGADEIDVQHLEPAIAFVEWSWANTEVLMRNWGVSVWLQIENKIERILRDHGAIMRRDLAHKCRSRLWSSREFAQVLDAMIKNGTVDVDAIGIHKWAA